MSGPTQIDPRSVYVKGLSFDATSDQFEAAFGEIGPVRRAFLLHKKDASHHSGAGFVQYALIEDAARAIKELDSTVLLGRTIQVSAAGKRPANAERRQDAKDKIPQQGVEAKPAKKDKKSSMDAKKALQSIALGGFPPQQVADVLKLAGLCGKVVASTEHPADSDIGVFKLKQDGCNGSVIFVTYATVKEACLAVTKLHRTDLNLTSKKNSSVSKLWARQLKGEGSMVKKWRVILRNLPFSVTEDSLLKLLSPAGFVWELTIPAKPDGGQRGFAFASFTSKAHAEKAIKLTNAQTFKGRVLAVDWAVSKADFQAPASNTPAPAQTSDDGQEDDADLASDSEGSEMELDLASDEEKDRNRSMASEFLQSLPDESLKTSIGKKRTRTATVEEEGSDDNAGREEPGEPGLQSQPKKARMEEISAASKSINAAIKAPQHHDSDKDRILRTVFVRGVASNQQKSNLQAVLSKFGRVRDCRLVMNAATQKPKGTAFVEFETAEDAQKAAAACKRAREGQGPGIVLAGKQLEVDIALVQEDARSLASGKLADRHPTDRRNLYLAQEGRIDQESQAWQDISKADQQKRARADREKATKLKSPNFFISTTRLSIRNLPGTVDEKQLKELLVAAVKQRATMAVPRLKQVKILMESERLTKEGNPASKGIAFAEFADHEHALCALRQLNNNPAVFGREKRPIVEFSVENAQTLKARDQREARRKQGKPVGKKEGPPGTSPTDQARTGGGGGKNKKPQQPAERKKKVAPGPQPKAKASGIAAKVAPGKPGRKEKAPIREPQAKAQREPKIDIGQGQTERIRRPHTQKQAAQNRQLAPKKQAQPKERKDKLDVLVEKYRRSLLGSTQQRAGVTKGSEQKDLKRWFE